MSGKPIQRVAHVRLTPNGKSYPMRCDRSDLGVGDNVEVEMYAGTKRAYFDDGVITAVEWCRWDCRCHVRNHAEEVSYAVGNGDVDFISRSVDLSKRKFSFSHQGGSGLDTKFEQQWESACSHGDVIYDAICHEDGEDAYLGDGIWVRPDGSWDDRGR